MSETESLGSERCTGVIQQNPLGPHYYVKTDDERRIGLVDAVTDMMNNWLVENDIHHDEIKPHTPIFTIEWTDERIDISYPNEPRHELLSEDWHWHN
jgi:hypothetical protein